MELTGQPGEDSLLRVQPVFGLGEDGVGVCFKGFFVDFLAPVGREAVHNKRVRLGQAH